MRIEDLNENDYYLIISTYLEAIQFIERGESCCFFNEDEVYEWIEDMSSHCNEPTAEINNDGSAVAYCKKRIKFWSDCFEANFHYTPDINSAGLRLLVLEDFKYAYVEKVEQGKENLILRINTSGALSCIGDCDVIFKNGKIIKDADIDKSAKENGYYVFDYDSFTEKLNSLYITKKFINASANKKLLRLVLDGYNDNINGIKGAEIFITFDDVKFEKI